MLNTNEELEAKLKDNIEGLFSDSLADDFPMDFITMDLENIANKVQFDCQKFADGVDSMAELCGQITALVNVGITPRDALDYIATKEATNSLTTNNLEIAKVKSDADKELAKHEFLQSQKTIL